MQLAQSVNKHLIVILIRTWDSINLFPSKLMCRHINVQTYFIMDRAASPLLTGFYYFPLTCNGYRRPQCSPCRGNYTVTFLAPAAQLLQHYSHFSCLYDPSDLILYTIIIADVWRPEHTVHAVKASEHKSVFFSRRPIEHTAHISQVSQAEHETSALWLWQWLYQLHSNGGYRNNDSVLCEWLR